MSPRVRFAALLATAGLALVACVSASAVQVDTIRLRPKVLVLTYDPIVKSEGGKRLHEVCGWKDPHMLAEGYASDIKRCSGGIVDYKIVKWIDADDFAMKKDGFIYDEKTYLDCFRKKADWHQPDAFDYRVSIAKYGLAEMVDRGEIDEVWMFGAPYMGWFESCMAGKGAFWVNGTPLPDVKCKRSFVMMGFNYERGVGEMLEDLGHRTESTMSKVYGSGDASKGRNAWEKFIAYDKVAPGKSGCGNVHFAPSSAKDYDWKNMTKVVSNCDDWLTYPEMPGTTKIVDATEWGGGEIRSHHNWWFTHMPKASGKTDEKFNDWWRYIVDFNKNVIGNK